jgi:hypothetical protein
MAQLGPTEERTRPVKKTGVGDETENPAPDKGSPSMEPNEDDYEGLPDADDEAE